MRKLHDARTGRGCIRGGESEFLGHGASSPLREAHGSIVAIHDGVVRSCRALARLAMNRGFVG